MASEQVRVTPDGFTVLEDGWESKATGTTVERRRRGADGEVFYGEVTTPDAVKAVHMHPEGLVVSITNLPAIYTETAIYKAGTIDVIQTIIKTPGSPLPYIKGGTIQQKFKP